MRWDEKKPEEDGGRSYSVRVYIHRKWRLLEHPVLLLLRCSFFVWRWLTPRRKPRSTAMNSPVKLVESPFSFSWLRSFTLSSLVKRHDSKTWFSGVRTPEVNTVSPHTSMALRQETFRLPVSLSMYFFLPAWSSDFSFSFLFHSCLYFFFGVSRGFSDTAASSWLPERVSSSSSFLGSQSSYPSLSHLCEDMYEDIAFSSFLSLDYLRGDWTEKEHYKAPFAYSFSNNGLWLSVDISQRSGACIENSLSCLFSFFPRRHSHPLCLFFCLYTPTVRIRPFILLHSQQKIEEGLFFLSL